MKSQRTQKIQRIKKSSSPTKKLKRKSTPSLAEKACPTAALTKPLKKKKILRYKKERCAFVRPDGTQCKRYAAGKSTLCKKHGGNPVIKENLLPDTINTTIQDKFDPAVHPIRYIELSQNGLSEVEIASNFGVSVEAIKRWSEKYDSFYTAYEIGKAMHEAWWLRQGKDGLNDRSFNTNLFKFLTMNKLGYSDKVEQKNTNTNLHGVLMIPDAVSEDEWEKDSIDV